MVLSGGTLERGWDTDYQSKASLINAAVGECIECIEDQQDNEFHIEDFDEDRARYLLRIKAAVSINDFLSEGEHRSDDRVGWNVSISHSNMVRSAAAKYIEKRIRNINKDSINNMDGCYDVCESNSEIVYKEDDEVKEVHNVKTIDHMMEDIRCLLRKADPASLRFSVMDFERWSPEYPGGSKTEFVLMRLPSGNNDDGNIHMEEIQFHYVEEYQCT